VKSVQQEVRINLQAALPQPTPSTNLQWTSLQPRSSPIFLQTPSLHLHTRSPPLNHHCKYSGRQHALRPTAQF